MLGISPDTPKKLAEFAQNDDLPFALLSDPDHTVLTKYGAWGEKKNYGRTVVGVIRSTFVIAPDGTITEAMYNVKATGHVARVAKNILG